MQTKENELWVGELSQAEGEECLANLQGLADQLDTAMTAIVQRKVSSLHDSLYLQQVNCARLADLRSRSVDTLRHSSGPEASSIDSDLAQEIKATIESVLVLNDRYAALLKHSGDTLRLLAGLYRSYFRFAQPASASRAAVTTWSCEI